MNFYTIEEAASELYEDLKQYSWLQGVSIGENEKLIVLTYKKPLESFDLKMYAGFEVEIIVVGKIRPAKEL
jgi:hypothetical protein